MAGKIYYSYFCVILYLAAVQVNHIISSTELRTCILKKRDIGKAYDVNEDEPLIEDARNYRYSHYGKNILRVQVLQRCGYKLCSSRRAKVYVYSSRRKNYCSYSRRHSRTYKTYECRYHRKPSKLVVYWPAYHKKLIISNIKANGNTVRALLPKSRIERRRYSFLGYCYHRIYPKTILITEQLQGKTCPTGRLRFPVGSIQNFSKRTLDGRLNNKKAIFNGAVGENLLRLSKHGYVDGISAPSGSCTAKQRDENTCPYPKENNGTGSNWPNPRLISNVLLRQAKDIPSNRGQSDLSTYFGQLLDHDTDLNKELPRTFVPKMKNDAALPIKVPKGDVIFDPDCKGDQVIPVRRFDFDKCTGNTACKCPRKQINSISSVIDANTVYGTDENRLKKLRTMKDGKLKTDKGNLPLNTFGLPNANAIKRDPTKLRIAGDGRANVAPTLLALHTLFAREHNRLAAVYKKRHPKANDEEIFQYARKILIAEMQAITYREYIPAILGRPLPRYKGYNPKINIAIATEFSHAAFRFGHTQINPKVLRFDKDGKVSRFGPILLREGYFRPERVTAEGGIDPILRGSVHIPCQEIDSKVVDELRNFLFPTNGRGLDLGAINIQRGRDTGIADYNSVRKALGLQKVKYFHEITKDKEVASKLKSLYKNVDSIDLWVGGIAEDHVRGSELGLTFEKIFINQFTRIRDGDRLWYQRILTKKEIQYVHKNTLSRIIRLNTGVQDVQKNVFFASDVCENVIDFQCVKHHRHHD